MKISKMYVGYLTARMDCQRYSQVDRSNYVPRPNPLGLTLSTRERFWLV